MKIELKNIKFVHEMSEETNCFHANLYVNGVFVGYAENSGKGGNTDYSAIAPIHNEAIRQCEKYCASQPEKYYELYDLRIPCTLESTIDDLLEDYLDKQNAKSVKKTIEKKQINSIVMSDDLSIVTLKFNKKIEDCVREDEVAFKSQLSKMILKYPEHKVMNTNIPKSLYTKKQQKQKQQQI